MKQAHTNSQNNHKHLLPLYLTRTVPRRTHKPYASNLDASEKAFWRINSPRKSVLRIARRFCACSSVPSRLCSTRLVFLLPTFRPQS